MAPVKQKIIQKRVQRKERFARMARIRYRKRDNVIAKSELLSDLEKCTDESTLVHQYCPGIFFGERDGGIDCETSMLNKNYITNCINIIKDEDVKLVQLKLCKNVTQLDSPSSEQLETWEKSQQTEWCEWAERFKNFSTVYHNFLKKHEAKFKGGSLDKESVKRYKNYLSQRKQVMRTKNCAEIKTRFNLTEDYVSEVVYNSNYIGDLGYGVDEFVDKILREGIPRIKCVEKDHGFLMKKMMDNFEAVFEKTMEFTLEGNPKLMGKSQNLKTCKEYALVSGYFYKKRAELSYIIIFDDIKPVPEGKSIVQTINMPIVKNESHDQMHRMAFLEKYYRPQIACLCCNVKEADVLSSEEEEEVCTKVEPEVMKIQEESNEINVEKIKEEHCNEMKEEYANTASNIVVSVPDRNRERRDKESPSQVLSSPYKKLLQSYMYLFQNQPFNYTNN